MHIVYRSFHMHKTGQSQKEKAGGIAGGLGRSPSNRAGWIAEGCTL